MPRRAVKRDGPCPFGWCQTGHHDRCRRSYISPTDKKTTRYCGCLKTGCPCAMNPKENA